ncbi:OmpA family protein [Ralstonia sp. UBA689]|uniref:OmpA family protein n=1 Tax=Ralstonia sp. UBA689 TaxID=1947373 RepID=UPI0025FF2549|nr:OmpA family protein [Ralstonia sp. UBA689]
MTTENQSERISLAVVAAVIGVLLSGVVIYAVRFVSGQTPAATSAMAVEPSTRAVERPIAPGAVALVGDAKQITISGTVPDEATKERLLKPARVLWGKDNVVDKVEVSAGALPLWWQSRPVDVLARLKQMTSFDLHTSSDGMQLSGAAPNDAVRSSIGTAAPGWIAGQLKSAIDVSINAGSGAGASAPSDSLLDEHIEFASGSTTLPDPAKARLDEIASLLKDDDRTIVITGHTDNQGSGESNRKLSLERAEAVRQYLASQGVPAERMRAAGAGDSQPVADNASPEGRQRNRRITFAVASAQSA